MALAGPPSIARLKHDSAGRPVPWFVAWIDGKPDFRVIAPGGIERAVRSELCWVCGERRRPLDATFLVGPMCAVNRTTAEPPSHLECAIYSARACPFLTTPGKGRREAHKPTGSHNPAGEMIARNPGVALAWTSLHWEPKSDGRGGVLFDLGVPLATRWFAEGRDATRAEVLASIASGLPILREMAEQESAAAVAHLDDLTAKALAWVPA